MPVRYAAFSCVPCRSSYSAAGSAKCSGCPANYYSPSGTIVCTRCPNGTMSYPGETSCRPRPTCNPDLDSEPIFSSCVDGQRSAVYRWREGTVCDTNRCNLPASQTVACAPCPRGYFINRRENSACLACGMGQFTARENEESCYVCPAGTYGPEVERYENLERMPRGFDTFCEMTWTESRDLCAFHRGWIVAQNSFTVLPSVPVGVSLVLKKLVNITQESGGYLQFTCKRDSASSAETLRLRVDGYVLGTGSL